MKILNKLVELIICGDLLAYMAVKKWLQENYIMLRD